MRLNIKFAMAFVGLVLVSVILVVIGMRGINFQVSTGKAVFESSLVPVANLAKMMIQFDALHSDLRDLVEADSVAKSDWAFTKMKVPMRDYDELMEQYVKTIPNNPLTADEKRKIVEDIGEQKRKLVDRLTMVAVLSRGGKQAESIALFELELKPIIKLMGANIRLLVDVSIQDAAMLGGEMESSRQRAAFWMLISLIIGAVSSALICLLLRYFVVKAQDEQQKAYKDMAAIFSEIPAPICVVRKADNLLLDANAAFVKMCSPKGKGTVLGSSILAYFECADDSQADIITRLEQGVSFKCGLKKDAGDPVELEIFSRAFVFKEQEAVAVCCMDLTQQLLQERALQDAVTTAEEASRMKSAFVANISHEIRTPLNGVIGFAELAIDDAGISDGVRNYINKIRISANGLLGIINDVLDLSKIESGKMELESTSFDLHDVFIQCEVINSATAIEKGIELHFANANSIGCKIIGDPTRLRQVLLNLLSNAIKFTDNGFVKLSFSLERKDDATADIHFNVEDSGIGMTSEQLAKIFQPFIQADSSTTRKYGGTGLGLAITKSIIELMGGVLVVESEPGRGSKFGFTLSFGVSDKPQAHGLAAVENTRMRPIFAGNILVCEDNSINQQVIIGHLSRIGLGVDIAPNGEAGVRMVKERMDSGKPFDLILMDIHMPVMDGLCATAKLVEMGITVPIVAMTANAMSNERDLYLARGMSDYIGKPFNSEELWDCLMKYLKPVKFEPLVRTMALSSSFNQSAPVSSTGRQGTLIDRKLGLARAAGSEELYLTLQSDFVKSNRTVLAELHQAMQDEDTVLAHRLAHTLKGVAGTIGALALQEAAHVVETALASGRDALEPEHLSSLEAELNMVLQELDYLCVEPAKQVASGHEFDVGKAVTLLDRLEPLLKQGNSASFELLDDIGRQFASFGEECSQLTAQIEDFEFEEAYKTVSSIRKILESREV